LSNEYFRENYRTYILYFILLLIIVPLETIGLSFFYGQISSTKTKNKLFVIFVLITIIVFLGICYYLKQCIDTNLIPTFLSFSRQKLFENSLYYYENTPVTIPVNSFINHVIHSTSLHQGILYSSINSFLPGMLIIVIVIGFLFFIDPWIAMVCMFGIFLIYLVVVYMGNKAIQDSMKKEEHYMSMSSQIHEKFSNIENIYLNSSISKENEDIKRVDNIYCEHYKSALKTPSLMYLIIVVLIILFFSVCIMMLYYKHKNKMITDSLYITTVILLGYFLTTSIKLSSSTPEYFDQIGMYNYSKKYLEDIIRYRPVDDKPDSSRPTTVSGPIVFSRVTFSYPDNKPILRDFSMVIPADRITVLRGRSGIGKTTLFRLLLRFYDITSGSITLNGIGLSRYPIPLLRKRIIYLNQKTHLFNLSVYENMIYGNDPDVWTMDVVQRLLTRYDLYQNFPNGLDVGVGENGQNISLGMQKLVILVRGILKDGSIYIFDEPLSGLDASSRQKVIRMITEHMRNKTVVIITHDNEILDISDHVIDL
jgi:ABC-type multidrug transport system fused ATPase/permease subunit